MFHGSILIPVQVFLFPFLGHADPIQSVRVSLHSGVFGVQFVPSVYLSRHYSEHEAVKVPESGIEGLSYFRATIELFLLPLVS
jgi:hypothetical protein